MSKPAVGVSLLLALLTGTASAAMTLTSTDLRSGAVIPIAHIYPRCGGENVSPALSWRGAPGRAKSFVLTMIDVGVKPDQWSHWVVVGLPITVKSLPRGATSLPTAKFSLADDEKATTLTALLSKNVLDRASLVGLVSAANE